MNILFLDIDSSRIRLFKDKQSRHTIFIAKTVKQAVSALHQYHFDVISLEHHIAGKYNPHDGGLQVVADIVQNKVKLSKLKVIIHTDDTEIAQSMFDLLKPFGFDVVIMKFNTEIYWKEFIEQKTEVTDALSQHNV